MNELRQPRRWASGADDAPPDLIALLQAAEHDLPNEAELSALGLLGPPTALGPDPTGAASTGTATTGTAATGTAAKQSALGLVAKWGTGTLLIGSGIWVATAVIEDSRVTPVAGTTLVSSSEPQATPPSPSSSLTAPQATLQAEGTQEAGAPVPTQARASNAPPSEVQPSEVQLLRAARAALAGSPAKALRLTEEHARRFGNGRLVQEREVIRISALQGLGRTKEAAVLQRKFDERFPGSAHRRKLSEPHD